MAKKKYTVEFRRKRKGVTHYKKRLKLISSRKPRLVIRKTLNNLIVQFVQFNPKGDKVIVSAHTKELTKNFGYKGNSGNIPASYLTGLLAGLKAKKFNIKEAILDIGFQRPSDRLYAALKGVTDANLIIPHSKEIIPKEERIKGLHIENYTKKLGEEKNKKFSVYIKSQLQPDNFVKHFEEVKKRILEKKW